MKKLLLVMILALLMPLGCKKKEMDSYPEDKTTEINKNKVIIYEDFYSRLMRIEDKEEGVICYAFEGSHQSISCMHKEIVGVDKN